MTVRGSKANLLHTLSHFVLLTILGSPFPSSAHAQTSPTAANPTGGLGFGSVTAERSAPAVPAWACDQTPAINTTGRTIDLFVPLRDIAPLGDVALRIAPDDAISIRVVDLQTALRRIVREEPLAALDGIAAEDGYATLDVVERAGFPLTFHHANLDLQVTIAPEARLRRAIGFAFTNFSDAAINAEPEPFSVYLGYRASADYNHIGDEAGFRGVRSYFDLNGRAAGVAFENQLDLDTDRETPFVRNASRIIYDHLSSSTRWQFGDLRYDQTFFQSAPDISGIGISRGATGLFGDRNIASTTTRSFTLRRPSTVEVRVNNALVRQLDLGPGTYDLQDLPLTDGVSDVQLTIIDDLGERETVQFNIFTDSSLLKAGESEFSTAFGILAPRGQEGPEYETDTYAVSGYYRHGLTDRITVEADAQAVEEAQLYGLGAVIGTGAGMFTVHASASQQEIAGSGYAARIEYLWQQETDDGRPRILAATLETRSEHFGGIEETTPSNPHEIVGMVRYTHPIGPRLSASVGADYFIGRGSQEDRYAASAFLSWQAVGDTSISFGVLYDSEANDDESEFNAVLTVAKRFGGGQSLSGSAQTRDSRYQASYARSPRYRIDDWGMTATVFQDDNATAVSADAVYYTNRANFEVAHTTSFAPDADEPTSQTTSARVAGSVAFTGGRFGVGQPLYDSFALVHGHNTLDGRQVLLRDSRTRERERGRSSALGPAIAPLASYSVQTIPYDVEDLPAGYNLGDGQFTVAPPLHAGYNLTVGSAYNVTVVGVLLDRMGEPVPLMGGMAESISNPSAPPVQFFTNRTGRFGASGLAPGPWRLRLVNGLSYVVQISEDQGSYVRLPSQSPEAAN